MRDFHIIHTAGGWQLREEGSSRARLKAPTKDGIVSSSAAWARRTATNKMPIRIRIHGVDGSTQGERIYPRVNAGGAVRGKGEVWEFSGINSQGARQLAPVLIRLKRYDEGR